MAKHSHDLSDEKQAQAVLLYIIGNSTADDAGLRQVVAASGQFFPHLTEKIFESALTDLLSQRHVTRTIASNEFLITSSGQKLLDTLLPHLTGELSNIGISAPAQLNSSELAARHETLWSIPDCKVFTERRQEQAGREKETSWTNRAVQRAQKERGG